MTDDDETVADVLRETGESETIPLLEVATGVLENPEALDYEDWVRPMKLTGGRVCLRVQFADEDGPCTAYVRRRSDGHLQYISNRLLYPRGCGPDDLKHHMGDAVIRPVLREDTPFGEED